MKTHTVWLALCVAAICPVGQALGDEVQCPATIAVDQKITNTPAGWTAGYNGFTNELASLTVYDGPPEEGASLVYSDQKMVADSVTQIWQLAPNDRGNWITCGYSNTAAQLTQKIPADVTRCEVALSATSALATDTIPCARPSALRQPHAASKG